MVIVALITTASTIHVGVPEVILSSGTQTTHPVHKDNMMEIFSAILEPVRTPTQLCIGYPPTWPSPTLAALQSSLAAHPKVQNVCLLDSALLAAYGVGRPTCLVIELSLNPAKYTVAAIVDFSSDRAMAADGAELWTTVNAVLYAVPNEHRPALFDNIVITGDLNDGSQEERVLDMLRERATLSTFPADNQFKSVTSRHVPEYHSELYKQCPHIQSIVSLFGAAISCKHLLLQQQQ